MKHPKDIGDRTTLAAMLALREAGFAVLVPFGENTRYDLVIDDGIRLARVQCKTGRLRGGAIRFAVCSCYGHHQRPGESRRDYHGQVDYFAVHCPDTSGVYLVPMDDLPVKVQAALRVDPARNCQSHGIRLASDYEISRVMVTREGLRASSGGPAPSA
jgi:PD-(D/E)XK endonuclease